MTALIVLSVAFVAAHRGVSGTRLRDVLIRRFGPRPYASAFTGLSLALVLGLGAAWVLVGPQTLLWTPSDTLIAAQSVIQPLALWAIVAGAFTPNPATAFMESRVDDAVRGALRISRHLFLCGVALASAGHIVAQPTPRNLVLFGTLLGVSVTGIRSIDAKRRRLLGPSWTRFAETTSVLPFAAIAERRQRFEPRELSPMHLLLAIALTVMAAWLH